MADADSLDISFSLDGHAQQATIGKRDTALPLLREGFGCTTLKAGCSPQGVCGSCAAIVGGKPRLTCTLPAKALDGKDVLTQASLGEEGQIIARAFAAEGLAQDGYAVPGMLIAFKALHDRLDGAPMDEAAAIKALQLHVCRSVGYDTVVRAFLRADAALRGVDPVPAGAVPHDLVAAALGTRPAVDDLRRPGMLHGAVVFAPHARCRVDGLDLDAARAVDGVVDILTADDLPAARAHGVCLSDWPVLVGVGETTRGCADLVAVVAAETRAAARAAAALVTVQAERLDPDTSVNHAAGHADRIIHRVEVHKGDARAALDGAAHVVKVHVETAGSDPCFVEPEAALAVPLEGGRLRVYGAGQDLFRDLEQLASVTGLDPDLCEVVHLPAGGSGGARLDMGVGPHAALLALRTDRPVKIALEMAEATRMHAGRHPTWSSVKLACNDEGHLVALHATVLLDTGGHTGAGPLVADTIARHASLAYDIEHVDLDVLCVRSDNPAAGASPGLGVPEYAFAVETALDRLAEDAGFDAFDLRAVNLIDAGQQTAAGLAVPEGWDPDLVLDAMEGEGGRLIDAGLTVGAALGVHVSALPSDVALAELEVVSAGHVRVHTGFSELSQGFHARVAATAAAATALPLDIFEVVTSTAADVPCGPTLSERDRRLGLAAVAEAAAELSAALADAGGQLEALVGERYLAESSAGPAMALCGQLAGLDDKGALAELVVVSDVGPDALDAHDRGLLTGAVQQAVEVAVMAEREVDADAMPETRWTKLGVLKARFAPKITLHPVHGPVRGAVLDAAAVPTAAALASALFAASGQWQDRLPMKATTVAKAMGVRPPRK